VVLKKHNKENNYTQNRLRHKVTGKLRDVLIISLRGGRNSTLSSEDSPHEASKLVISRRDHGGGGGTGLQDGSTVKVGSSIKTQRVE